jgi:hypothetical protein
VLTAARLARTQEDRVRLPASAPCRWSRSSDCVRLKSGRTWCDPTRRHHPHVFQWIRMRSSEGRDGRSNRPVRTISGPVVQRKDARLRTWRREFDSLRGLQYSPLRSTEGHRFPKPTMVVRVSQRGPTGRRERWTARQSPRTASSPRSAANQPSRWGGQRLEPAYTRVAPDRRLDPGAAPGAGTTHAT